MNAAGGFPPSLLSRLAAVREISIRTAATPRGVVIWVVVVEGAAYIRSYRGRRGKWYEAVLVDPAVTIDVEGLAVPARVEAVGEAATVEAVSRAFAAKYADSPYLPAMLTNEVLGTTLLLSP